MRRPCRLGRRSQRCQPIGRGGRINGPLLHPRLKVRNHGRWQSVFGRHLPIRVAIPYSVHEETLRWLPRNGGWTGVAAGEQGRPGIEAQSAFQFGAAGAVTLKTMFHQHRTNALFKKTFRIARASDLTAARPTYDEAQNRGSEQREEEAKTHRHARQESAWNATGPRILPAIRPQPARPLRPRTFPIGSQAGVLLPC